MNRLSQNPMRITCGVGALNDALIPNIPGGAKRNQSIAYGKLAATPEGYSPPYSWILPETAGAMSSHSFTFVGITASGRIEIVPAAIIGQTTIAIDPTGSMFAFVSGDGTATIGIMTDMETGAIGWMEGPTILDISTDMTAYARGFMDGTTEDLSTLTPANVGQFVWAALQSEIGEPGSAGAALLAAGSAGDPWATLYAPYTDDATFGAFVKKLLQTNEFFGLR